MKVFLIEVRWEVGFLGGCGGEVAIWFFEIVRQLVVFAIPPLEAAILLFWRSVPVVK